MKKQKCFLIVAIIMVIALLSACSQESTITCGACGATLPSNVRFCSECGATLVADTTLEPKTTTEPHSHSFGEWEETKAPTCTSEGEKTRTCSCGETETASVAALGHTEVVEKAVAATCTKTGLTEGKYCSVCRTVFALQKTVPTVAHTYDNQNDTTCNACGYVRAATCQHTNTQKLAGKAATCTATGLTEGKKCADCSATLVAQTTIPATGHTEVVDKAVDATCTKTGLTEGKHCSVCNKVIVAQTKVPTVSHTYDDKYDTTCNVCGYVRVAECKHTNTQKLAGQAATCTAAGLTEGKKCVDCSEILVAQTTIPATGHTAGEWTTVTNPTCTATGTKEQKCKVCGTVINTSSIAALGHTEVIDKAVAATCTASGLTEGKHCSVCNATIVAQKTVNALGHTEVIDKAVAATCTKTGLTEGKHCSTCQKVLVAQTAVAVQHNVVNNVCTFCNMSLRIPEKYIDATMGFITAEDTVITTDHLKFSIAKNVYVPDDFVEIINKVTSSIETVSGMKFDGDPHYCTSNGEKTLASVTVAKKGDSEQGYSFAAFYGATVYPIDLIDLTTLTHESIHLLQLRQSHWHYCTWAMEGISTYTTYRTECYILEHYPNLSMIVGAPSRNFFNLKINDYSKLYEYPMEYWMENTFEYALNNNYSIGFRFMWFLDDVYGDYTKWLYTYEEYNPNHSNNMQLGTMVLPKEEQIKAFKMAYGENVFEEFYAWLKGNEHKFDIEKHTELIGAEEIAFYPMLTSYSDWYTSMTSFDYKDVVVDLTGGIYYLTEYKNKNVDSLQLSIEADNAVEIYLYDRDGNYIKSENIMSESPIDISGVYYIKLVGEGTISRFEITGYI